MTRFMTMVLVAIVLGGCTAMQANLPAVTAAPTNLRLPGKFIWHDLLTNDPKASQRFYSELFGWQFESVDAHFGELVSSSYTLIRHDGALIGGMLDVRNLQPNIELSQWVGLMSTDDIDAAIARLRQMGGTVFTPPTDLADRGRIAVVADPEGAVFALLQARDGDPRDTMPRIDGFLWDEVWSNDVDAAAAFYQELTGLSVDMRPVGGDHSYVVMESDTRPRFGILKNPDATKQPLWTPYLRVADPSAITSRVEALGGQVLVPPRARALGGEVAVILGPSGAGIVLQTWDPAMAAARRH